MKQRGKRTTARTISPLGWIGAGIATIITLFYVIEYIRMDTLSVYDAAGHLQAVNGMMQTWPALTSWQPETLLGWWQGTLYPPLTHWLAAGLGLLIGANAALKTVVIVSLVATPVTLWWWLRSMKIDPLLRWPTIIAVLTLLSLLPAHLGASITGLFNLGMVTSFSSVPFIFAILALIHMTIASKQKRWFIVLGVVFGLLIWSHVVGAIIAGVYFAAAFVHSLIRRNTTGVYRLLYAAAITFLISAPFIFLFLTHMGKSIGNMSAMTPDVAYVGLVFIAAASVLAYLFLAKQSLPSIALSASLALTAITALDIVFRQSHPYDSSLGEFYLYRLEPFMFIFVGVGIVSALQATLKINTRYKHNLEMATAVLCILLAVPLLIKNPTMTQHPIVTMYGSEQMNGRFIETFYRTDAGSTPYAFQTKLLENNPDTMWANGLFIESEPSAPFVKSLSISLNPMAALNDDEVHYEPEQVIVWPERLHPLLDYFGIRYTVTLNDNRNNAAGTWSYNGTTKYYHINDLGDRKIADVAPYALDPVTDDWEQSVLEWWNVQGPIERLPYNAANGTISGSDAPVNITVEKWDTTGITVTIDSDVDTLTIIKASYSPDWTASDSDGNPVTLYQAAPNMILLSSHGTVTLKP